MQAFAQLRPSLLRPPRFAPDAPQGAGDPCSCKETEQKTQVVAECNLRRNRIGTAHGWASRHADKAEWALAMCNTSAHTMPCKHVAGYSSPARQCVRPGTHM